MLKTNIFVAFGFLTAVAWGNSVAWGDGGVAEIPSSKVIQSVGSPSAEKPPVISGLNLDGSGKFLAAAGDDHLVRIFDLDQGTQVQQLAAHTDWVKTAVFRPDGNLLATAGADRRIRLWEMSAKDQPQVSPVLSSAISTLAFSPDGRRLAAAGFDGNVWIFNADDASQFQELVGPGSDLRALAFSPDGMRLAAAGRAGVVRIWDSSNGRQTADVRVSPRRICALAYSPDGKLLAAAGQQRIVSLLDGATAQAFGSLPERPGETLSICFCGNRLLASGGSSNAIHVWRIETKQEVGRCAGHTGSVATLAYDARNETLLSGSFDTTVRVWPVGGLATETLTQR